MLHGEVSLVRDNRGLAVGESPSALPNDRYQHALVGFFLPQVDLARDALKSG